MYILIFFMFAKRRTRHCQKDLTKIKIKCTRTAMHLHSSAPLSFSLSLSLLHSSTPRPLCQSKRADNTSCSGGGAFGCRLRVQAQRDTCVQERAACECGVLVSGIRMYVCMPHTHATKACQPPAMRHSAECAPQTAHTHSRAPTDAQSTHPREHCAA
jgi:hypothetical protein